MNIIKSCVLCVMLIVLSGYLQINASSFSGAATFVAGGAAATYLLEEKYEGVGIPSGHSYVDSSGTNKIDWDSTTVILEGTESVYFPDPGGSGQNKVQIDPGTDEDEMWASMIVQFATTVASSTAQFFRISDTGDTDVIELARYTDGDIRIITNGGGTISDIVCTTSNDITYYIKLRAKKGTGANAIAEVWCTTSTSSWNASESSTDGDWTTQVDYIEINNYFTHDHNFYMDHVIIDDEDIPITAYQ